MTETCSGRDLWLDAFGFVYDWKAVIIGKFWAVNDRPYEIGGKTILDKSCASPVDCCLRGLDHANPLFLPRAKMKASPIVDVPVTVRL